MELSMSYSEGKIAPDEHDFDRTDNHGNPLKNINPEWSEENVYLVHDDVKKVYSELFGEALEKHNQKQIEKGHPERQIEDYYEHMKKSKQQQPEYEAVVQFGNNLTFSTKDQENRKLGKQMLSEFAQRFAERYPNLRIVTAAIHVDEFDGTPHLHLKYIPVAHNQKRGLETCVSLNQAFKEMGYDRVAFLNEDSKKLLEEIGREHGIDRLECGNHEPHRDVSTFKAWKAEDIANYPFRNDPVVLNAVQDLLAQNYDQSKIIEELSQNMDNLINAYENKPILGGQASVNKAIDEMIAAKTELNPKIERSLEAGRTFATFATKIKEHIQSIPTDWRNYIINPVTERLRGAFELIGVAFAKKPAKGAEKAPESVPEQEEVEYGLDSESKDMTQAKSLQDTSSGQRRRNEWQK